MWIELCVGVGAPHVSGVGGLGEIGSDLLCLCGVYANGLAFAGEEVGCILEWEYAVEALTRVWHGGGSNAYALLGSVGNVRPCGRDGCGGVLLGWQPMVVRRGR